MSLDLSQLFDSETIHLMARGVRGSSSTALATPELPEVSFIKIDGDLPSPTTGVDD